MLLLREYSSRSLSENLARTACGLFVAGPVAWLAVLYRTAPFDF
jgi:biopolymer transport protein ExbB/TolQ